MSNLTTDQLRDLAGVRSDSESFALSWAADEIERLRAALFAIEAHGGSAETYDPVVEGICRGALSEKDSA